MKNYTDKRTQKETINADLALIEQDQLSHSNNDVNVYDRVDDTSKDFAKLDDVTIGGQAKETEFPVYSEMDRFSKKHEISQDEYKQNKGNKTQ